MRTLPPKAFSSLPTWQVTQLASPNPPVNPAGGASAMGGLFAVGRATAEGGADEAAAVTSAKVTAAPQANVCGRRLPRRPRRINGWWPAF
ncbi:MAG: hypothetical protein OEN56_15320 [Gemmatimonadota bacterium]|nr:hypothetical protein [Gemmatimonadota bacterium]